MRVWLLVGCAGAGLLTVAWLVAGVLASGHGLDLTDEGFYLLSYRWWSSTPRTFTGFQYLLGPLFDLLGHNVRDLRLARLVLLLVANLALGITFMQWLRTRRPSAPPSRLWEAAGVLTITASGGATLSWLPSTPGYNDLVLVEALILAATVFRTAVRLGLQRNPGLVAPFIAGVTMFCLVLTKWSAGIALLPLVIGVAAVMLAPVGLTAALRWLALLASGFVVAATTFDLLVASLPGVIRPMVDLNNQITSAAQSPVTTLTTYLTSSLLISALAVALATPACAVFLILHRRRFPPALVALLAGGLLVVTFTVVGVWSGGRSNLPRYSSGLAAAGALLVLATATAARGSLRQIVDTSRSNRSTNALIMLLVFLPLAQGFGTSNALYTVAVNCVAPWFALGIGAFTHLTARATPAVWMAGTALTLGATLAVSAGVTGTVLHPYRTEPYGSANARATAIPELSSLRLPAREAHDLDELKSVLGPRILPGTPVLGFDEMAGVVFALRGHPVGEGWVSITDPGRIVANLQSVCALGPLEGARRPVLLFNRPVAQTDRDALAECGLSLGRDYVQAPLPPNALVAQAWFPRSSTR